MNGTLYVQGGYAARAIEPDHAMGDFFSLSLSKPWNDTAPPWESLPPNVPLGNTLAFLAEGGMAVPRQQQSSSLATTAKYPVPVGLGPYEAGIAVIDPESQGYGDLYAPTGIQVVDEPYYGMLNYSVQYNGMSNLAMPPSPMPSDLLGFSFAYCTPRKSIMLYGGLGEVGVGTPNPYLFEYLPKQEAWSFLVSVLVLPIPLQYLRGRG